MARFRRARRFYGRARASYSRRSRGRYSGKLMNGLLPNGPIKNFFAGLGAAVVAQRFIGSVFPYQDNVIGLAAGGAPGLAAPFVINYIPSMGGTNGTSGGTY